MTSPASAPPDIERLVLRAVRDSVQRFRYRTPIRTAAVGANGAALFSAFTDAPVLAGPGSLTQEHVTGHLPQEGFESPIHVMVSDGTGRATVATFRGGGEPTFAEDALAPK